MGCFQGRTVIVTGGANGIGRAICKGFSHEGAYVYVVDIDDLGADQTLKEMDGDGKYIHVNMLEADEIEGFFAQVYAERGRIDHAICNAGIQIRHWATEFPISDFDKVIATNMRAYYLCARNAAIYMKKNGGGSIVCTSSVNSMKYHSQRSAYNISKAAVNGLVGTLGVEWARDSVRINAVAPGYVLTEVMESGIREGIIDEKNIKSVIPMKRYILPEEIAEAVMFLASDKASAITGQVLCVDGGWSVNAIPEE